MHPEAASLEDDLAYLKTKVDAGASFLITQLFFDNEVYWSFVAAARERGIDVPIIPGVIPIASYAQVARICSLCDAAIPPELDSAMQAMGGDLEAEALLGVAYASRQCEELLGRRRARHPLLCAQPRSGNPSRPERAAGVAAVGAPARAGRWAPWKAA